MHPKGSVFISFGANKGRAGEGVEFFFGSQCVLNMFHKFSMCSPICSQQHLTLSHILWHKFYPCNQYKQPKKETTIYLFWEYSSSDFLIFWGLQANQRCPSQKERTLGGTHNQLIRVTHYSIHLQDKGKTFHFQTKPQQIGWDIKTHVRTKQLVVFQAKLKGSQSESILHYRMYWVHMVVWNFCITGRRGICISGNIWAEWLLHY